jgi:hypothetical protein
MKAMLAVIAFWCSASACAASCSAESPQHTVALVELYTSEGCSDCPAADQWLRSLRPGASSVPIAFHVDYWDYIGWKDPFARAAFSARQRELGTLSGRKFVYTPQVLLSGRDYRRWNSAAFAADVKAINSTTARASISIAMTTGADGRIAARATARLHRPATAVLHFALTESGLANAVNAGENRGVVLRPDHVAREWAGPVPVAQQAAAESALSAVRRGAGGALAFVQDPRSGEVLQALFLPYCPA